MTLAQAWLEAAWNRSASNDAGKLAVDAELLDHLNRLYQRFYALFAKARPDEAGSQTTVLLVGTPATATLAADLIAISAARNGLGAKVHLIPASEAERLWHMAPAVLRRGNTLVSRGLAGDPLVGDVLTVEQLDAPPALTALGSVVDARFPTRHHQLVIDGLALYLDTKDDGRSADAHGKVMAEFGQALAAFMAEYDLSPDALEWAHEPVKRAKGGSAR